MAIVKFQAKWSHAWQKQYNIPKGYLLLKPEDRYLETLRTALSKLHKYQQEKACLRDLDISIEIHYKKRTLSMNNLMWALYEIEANEMNGGISGHKDQLTTVEKLYEDDVREYAPRLQARIKKEMLPVLSREYNRYEVKQEKDDTVFVELILSTSHMNTVEHAKWIDRQFNRLSYMGVSLESGAELKDYWLKFRGKLNDEKIILYDDIVSKSEYKALQPLCEASGDDLSNGGGEIAHIEAVGMGGHEEPEKDRSCNWLHLRYDIHRELIHGPGWETFLKTYPHLENKVRAVMKKEFTPLKNAVEEAQIVEVEESPQDAEENVTTAQESPNKRGLAIIPDQKKLVTYVVGQEPTGCFIVADPGDKDAAIAAMIDMFSKDEYLSNIMDCCRELKINPELIDESLGIY